MAKAFIYDNIGLLEATLTDGSHAVNGAEGQFNPDATLTNEERATDQSIGLAVSAWAQNDMLRIDLGASPGEPDTIAVFFNALENDNIKIYGGAHATDLDTSVELLSWITAFTANTWIVSALSAGDYQYYFIRSSSAGGLVGLCEIIIGKIYTFEEQLLQGGIIGDDPGVNILTSQGGIEFANKKHDPKTRWTDRWGGLSASEKTNLESFRDDVGVNYKKFLYSEDGTTGPFHWVRMTPDSLYFTNEAGKVSYSAPITLIEQLQ